MDLTKQMTTLAKKAKEASGTLALLSTRKKDKILKDMARALADNREKLIAENMKDLKAARAKGLSKAMIDRLILTEKRVDGMIQAMVDVTKLKDPVGHTLREWRRPNGLKMQKVAVPLGAVLVIYESRPNVTAECVSLCLKSGNSIILKGGSEAFHSNQFIAKIFKQVLKQHKIPDGSVSFVATRERKAVDALVKLDQYITVVIPRGGEGLIRAVVEKSKIPVIKHYKGVCHAYVDKFADLDMAEAIVINGKTQRPGVCNALETMLVHKDIAKTFLPSCVEALQQRGCIIRGCDITRALLKDYLPVQRATKKDYEAEYLDLILAVRVVASVDEAIAHISQFGSGHTETIITKKKKHARLFVERVDASSVMVNASTRFSDGNQYGLGAEIGISTDKIHARGPMGLEGLTSYKYVVIGTGQVRP